MKFTWKNMAICMTSALALCLASAQSYAQEAANKLAELLPKMAPADMADEAQVRDMEASQQDWMKYCLQDCAKTPELRAESIEAMCEALKADTPLAAKTWLLHIMQWVGDDSCVDTVAGFLTSDQPALVDAAARVLAQIPTDKALAALNTDAEKFASYIKARTVNIEIGVETELPLALSVVSPAVFDAYMKSFNNFDNDTKARALGAVRNRAAKDYLGVVVASVDSDNDQVKRAALLALEKIATAEQFDLLYKQLKEFDRGFVARIVKNVVGDDFDAAVVAALKKEKDAGMMSVLAEIVGDRWIKTEVGTLLELAKDKDCPARLPLLAAAEKLATKANIADFVDASLNIENRGDRDRAEQIISRLCAGDASPVVEMMNAENAPALMLLLGRIGGDAALKTIEEKALNASDVNTKAFGVRALCSWPNAVVWEKLLAAAQNQDYPEQVRIQALRAFIRVVSLPDDQDAIDMSGKDKLENLKKAFELATRDDERNFVLERVGSIREPESVEFALQFVDKPELSNKALNAILDLAHQDYLRKQNKELFLKALDVVLAKGDQGQKDRAANYKANIR